MNVFEQASAGADDQSPEQREADREFALAHNIADWAMLEGPNLITRTDAFEEWCNARRRADLVPVFRGIETEPGPRAISRLESGRLVEGLNLASQDYLGLSTHPQVKEAAIRAVTDHGVNSTGSAALQGGTRPGYDLEAEIGELVQAEHVTLFPTGWGAGFGVINALIRPGDHIVMDRLAHACLQQGAHATGGTIHRHDHLDVERAAEQIRSIRAEHPDAGILVVTEGTFSMDADSPDLRVLVEASRANDATLLVDTAHDLGELGPQGTGQIGLQGLLGQVDLVMGAFSKTFASCGGFIASSSQGLKDYLRIFAGTFMFSNALSPVQAAVALEAMRIVRSPQGDELRAELMRAAMTTRTAFAERGFECYGDPCAIVAVPVGDETVASFAHQILTEAGVLVNAVAFPAVSFGEARFRLQLMPGHTDEMLLDGVETIVDAVERAREMADARVKVGA